MSIRSIKERREYNREKGEYKKVDSKEIEVIPRVVEDRFEFDHGGRSTVQIEREVVLDRTPSMATNHLKSRHERIMLFSKTFTRVLREKQSGSTGLKGCV